MKNHAPIGLDEVAAVHTGPDRLYHSLGQLIRSKIQSGEWPVGEKIPSERTLMQVFGVSRATVRQAVDILIKEGILYRVHGKGTFSAPQKMKQGVLRLLELPDLMRRNGMNPSARLLGKGRYDPPMDIRRSLALSDGEEACWYQRLVLVDGEPILIENTYFAARLFPDLLEVYAGLVEPLAFISDQYGIRAARESEIFEPVILESYEANLLGVKQGFPALWVEFNVFDMSGSPLVFGTSVLRGDRCRLYVDLTMDEGSK